MFKSIVAGTNGSSSSRGAVAAAAALAREHDATLHLVWAFRTSVDMAGAMPLGMSVASGSSDAELHADIEAELGRLADELRRDKVTVQTYPCPQAAAAALLDVAAHQNADLIVVGNKGMKGPRRVLGSVPNTVAHEARCAVLIVPTV